MYRCFVLTAVAPGSTPALGPFAVCQPPPPFYLILYPVISEAEQGNNYLRITMQKLKREKEEKMKCMREILEYSQRLSLKFAEKKKKNRHSEI